MTTQTGYFRITSAGVGLRQSESEREAHERGMDALRNRPRIPSWSERSEQDYLARSHPGPGAAEQAVEQALWDQVCGKASAAAQPSVKLQSDWAKLQASLNRQRLLEEKLFSQVAASGFQPE